MKLANLQAEPFRIHQNAGVRMRQSAGENGRKASLLLPAKPLPALVSIASRPSHLCFPNALCNAMPRGECRFVRVLYYILFIRNC
jgi:hypothetical protein